MVLVTAAGERLHFERRKARKQSLFDAHGNPLPNEWLDSHLGGIRAEDFSSTHALGHSSFVEGSQDLLSSKGRLGEAIFAAIAGREGRIVQETLKSKLDELFSQRATGKPINRLLSDIGDLEKKIRDLTLKKGEYASLADQLQRYKTTSTELRDKIENFTRERERLQWLIPLKQKFSVLEEKRRRSEELQHLPHLPQSFGEDRARLMERERKANADLKLIADNIVRNERAQTELILNDHLWAQKPEWEVLLKSESSLSNSLRDRPSVLGQAERAESEARTEVSRLGLKGSTIELAALAPASHDLEELETVATQFLDARNESERLQGELDLDADEISRLETSEINSQTPRDLSGLEAGLATWNQQAPQEKRISDRLQILEGKGQDIIQKILDPLCYLGPLLELQTKKFPSEAECERYKKGFEDLKIKGEKLAGKSDDAIKRASAARLKLQELEVNGEIPLKDDLMKIRSMRDRGWELVKNKFIEGIAVSDSELNEVSGKDSLPLAFERSIGKSDASADALIGNGENVGLKARLKFEADTCDVEVAACKVEADSIGVQLEQMLQDWIVTWNDLGRKPDSPEIMKDWLRIRTEIIKQSLSINHEKKELDELSKELEAACSQLKHVFSGLGISVLPIPSRLSEWVLAIDFQLKQNRELTQKIGLHKNALENARAKHAKTERRKKSSEEKQVQIEKRWNAVLLRTNTPETLGPEAAKALANGWNRFLERLREAEEKRIRVGEMTRVIEEFSRRIDVVGSECGISFSSHDPLARHKEIGQLIKLESIVREKLERAKTEHVLLSESYASTEKIQIETRLEIESMCRQAGCNDASELEGIFTKAIARTQFEGQVVSIESEIREQSNGESLVSLADECRKIDLISAQAKISQLKIDASLLEEDLKQTHKKEGEIGNQIDDHAEAKGFVEALEQSSGKKSEVNRAIREYLVFSMAKSILDEAMELMAHGRRDPILERASTWFSDMTDGAYGSVRAEPGDDSESLVVTALTSAGIGRTPDQLSDGTRDQLYLAMRLAGLEVQAEHGVSLPLVFDDLLIQFDDKRARGALEVLCEVGINRQVILFTHHNRIVELAKGLTKRKIEILEL